MFFIFFILLFILQYLNINNSFILCWYYIYNKDELHLYEFCIYKNIDKCGEFKLTNQKFQEFFSHRNTNLSMLKFILLYFQTKNL